jgi:hypothetical protein
MSAIQEFRKAYRDASPEHRRSMLRLVFFPHPTKIGNVVMYLNIMFHLTVIYGVVGMAVYHGFTELAAFWGDVPVVRFLLGMFIADAMLSLTLNRVSGSLLKGIDARKRYEMAKLSKDMQSAIRNMMERMASGEHPDDVAADAEAILPRSMDDVSVKSKRVMTDDPVKTALEHLEAQDRAMRDQEDTIRKVHDADTSDPIQNLLKQLEEQDRKNRENRDNNDQTT